MLAPIVLRRLAPSELTSRSLPSWQTLPTLKNELANAARDVCPQGEPEVTKARGLASDRMARFAVYRASQLPPLAMDLDATPWTARRSGARCICEGNPAHLIFVERVGDTALGQVLCLNGQGKRPLEDAGLIDQRTAALVRPATYSQHAIRQGAFVFAQEAPVASRDTFRNMPVPHIHRAIHVSTIVSLERPEGPSFWSGSICGCAALHARTAAPRRNALGRGMHCGVILGLTLGCRLEPLTGYEARNYEQGRYA